MSSHFPPENREENPLLANELAFSEKALGQFSMMTEDEKRQVIDAARGAQTKEQMAQIVKDIADMEFF